MELSLIVIILIVEMSCPSLYLLFLKLNSLNYLFYQIYINSIKSIIL